MLRERVLSASLFVPLILVPILLGGPWLHLSVGLLTIVAAWEAFALLGRAGLRGDALLGIALAAGLVLAASTPPDLAGPTALVLGAALVLPALEAFRRRDAAAGLTAWMVTLFGALYCGLLAFLVRIVQTAPQLAPGTPLSGLLDGGRAWLLLLVLLVWAYDTLAYVVGRLAGRHRFLTQISPGKTWEGAIGGALAATAVAAVGLTALGQPPLGAILLGPLVSGAAQAGDLAESMLKRAAGVKDASTLIPGHGGVLDRVDSFLFAAPAAYLYLLLVVGGR